MKNVIISFVSTVLAFSVGSYGAEVSEHDHEELARKLTNPVAHLISIPFQFNYDSDIGPFDTGKRLTLKIQPVIPMELNKDWNVISRTIVPIVYQDDLLPGIGSQSGLSDTVQSFFFSPKEPTENGWIWGAGPVFTLPTATEDLLGTKKWGVGPTAVALKMEGPWTYGVLGNHIWSVAGESNRPEVNETFVQPFVAYTTKTATTYYLGAESTYDWKREDFALPVTLTVSQVLKLGDHIFSIAGGVTYWAESSEMGPEGLGFRVVLTMILPQ